MYKIIDQCDGYIWVISQINKIQNLFLSIPIPKERIVKKIIYLCAVIYFLIKILPPNQYQKLVSDIGIPPQCFQWKHKQFEITYHQI